MSEEKISDLDKRVALIEISLSSLVPAVKELTNSTNAAVNSNTEMTAELRGISKMMNSISDDAKESRAENKVLISKIAKLETEIAVIKRGNKWQEHAEKFVIMLIMGVIFYGMDRLKG